MPSDEKRMRPIALNVPGEEIDKAAADVLRSAIGRTADGLVDFSTNIFSGLIGDRVREWRVRNLVSGAKRTADFLREKGIDPSNADALPMGDLYRLFSAVSEEDDPDLQDLWARLIACKMDPSGEDIAARPYADLIKRLTPYDAITLSAIDRFHFLLPHYNAKIKSECGDPEISSIIDQSAEFKRINNISNKWASHFTRAVIGKYDDLPEEILPNSIETLIRLGCIVRADRLVPKRLDNFSSQNLMVESRSERTRILDAERTVKLLADLVDFQRDAIEMETPPKNAFVRTGDRINCVFKLTRFSTKLMDACREIPKLP